MKKIPLKGKHGEGKFALVDAEDFEELNKYTWLASERGYALRRTNQGDKPMTMLMHRQVIGAEKGQVVDHINRDKLDNRRSNLRIVTQAQNTMNRSGDKTNISGFKGVYWQKNRQNWQARISKDYVRVHIGTFDDPEEAARAYDTVAAKLFGEYALLNFPDSPPTEIKPRLQGNNTSGYRGVSWSKRMNKWAVRVCKGSKVFYSGHFDCKELAAKKYNEKAIEAFGEKAKLNPIEKEADA